MLSKQLLSGLSSKLYKSLNLHKLTYRFIWSYWFVIETKKLCQIIKIWMLNNQILICVIHPIIEISNSDLHTPILLVAKLNVLVNSNWHMTRTSNQRHNVIHFGGVNNWGQMWHTWRWIWIRDPLNRNRLQLLGVSSLPRT